MKPAKNKFHSSSFVVFRKVLAVCFFLCCLHTFTCLGYSPLLGTDLKDSLDSRYPIDTLADFGNDYAYFNRFNSALLHSHNRFDDFVLKRQDLLVGDVEKLASHSLIQMGSISSSVGGYILIVDAPFNPGCLCQGDPLLVTAKINQPPVVNIDIDGNVDNRFYYTDNKSISLTSTPPFTTRDALKEPLSFFPPMARDRIINGLTSNLPLHLFLRNGPITTTTLNAAELASSFGQSAYNLVRMLLVVSGQEMYIKALESGGAAISILLSGLRNAGLPIPDISPGANNSAFFNGIITNMTTNNPPIGYSVPIGFYTKMGDAKEEISELIPYTRPVYRRPKPITPTITTNGPVYIKPWSIAKHSLYVLDGDNVTFSANPRFDEDPNDGPINYWWAGFPSVTALGFGQAILLAGKTKVTTPFTIKMNSPYLQSGVYALMAYRGPMPPIGCTRISEWTEVNVGCSGDASNREGLIQLEGDYDFAHSKEGFFYFDNGKRDKRYEPVVGDGETIKIVSSDDGYQGCEWTYEWFGPQKILKEGTTNTYVITPNVLIGGSKTSTVDILGADGKKTGETANIDRPIESNETLTLKMTPEMSGVYTRIASRTTNGAGLNPAGLFCPICFRIAQLTITVKPSPPKLTANSPVCEGEELVISISRTTTDVTRYRWAHKSNPSDPDPDPGSAQWSAWSTQSKIKRPNATTDMSGIYLVKAQSTISYPGKGRGTKRGTDKTSICESVNPVTITVEVKPKVYVNLSLSKNTVYAGGESILTASFSGTVTAPAGGITITLKDLGGSAIRGTDYVPLPPSMYIPANENSVSTTIATKWTKPATDDLAKTLVVTGSVTNGTTPSDKTCYVPTPVTLVINPLFKPAVTNGPVSPICSGDIVHIELSSTLLGTTYEWTASKGIGNVSGFASSGSSSTIHETLTNYDQSLSGTVVYTITPRVEDPEDPSLYVNGESTSLTVTVVPISKKVVAPLKQTSEDVLSFDWKPENTPKTNVTYRWYTHADKTGGVIQEGKGANGVYSIPTTKPGNYKYYITSQEDGYCENEGTEIELTAVHHIQLTFDKPEVQQGENAILTARLSGAVIAPDGGISITLNETGSSAEKGIHYNGLLPSIYIPKGNSSVSITITTQGFNTMDVDKVLVVNGYAKDYTIKEAAALTITRNTDNNKITLTFNEPTVDGGRVAKLTASLPPNIRAGHQITIRLDKDDLASQALVSKNYEDLQTSITIPRDENAFTINGFTAKNNCVIDGSTTLTLRGVDPAGYEIQKPNPAITILDKTGDNPDNMIITLDFEFKEVRGSETDLLKICLPNCVTSVNPIHIRLRKRRTAFPSETAKVDINYQKFSWDITIPANTSCTSIVVHTLLDRNSDTKTLWLTGKVTDPTGKAIDPRFHINSDKVKIITPKILVPNVFTPNGDGHHDTWEINDLDLYKSCMVTVYNRWGQLVFKSIGYPKDGGWDGISKGRPLPVGAYFYIIDLKDGSLPLRGSVSIIR